MNCQDIVFPSWNRRGGCASKKKTRSLRSGADGVVIMVHVDVVTLFGTDHPVCGASVASQLFIDAAATPPHEEGSLPSICRLLCKAPSSRGGESAAPVLCSLPINRLTSDVFGAES